MKRRSRRQSSDKYFASLPIEEFLPEMHGRIRDYYGELASTGLSALIRKSYNYYYGGDEQETFAAGALSRKGRQGEVTGLKLNHYRNVLKHTLQLTTTHRPAFQCRAINSDYDSQTQTVLGNGLLDYYLREKHLNRILSAATENALWSSEGWIHLPWSPSIGEKVPGTNLNEGDVQASVHSVLDVVRDVGVKNDERFPWLAVRTFINRFDLAAERPDLADKVLAIKAADYESNEAWDLSQRSIEVSDFIPTFWFYHNRTPAMPEGRVVHFAGDVCLYDGPLPYEKVPLYKIAPDKLLNSAFSYTPAWELLGAQQALDIIGSTIMSNQASFGLQSLWQRKGDNLAVTDLGQGMRLLQSEEPPQPLQLTRTAPETYNWLNMLIGQIETLSGISATVRGNPEANLKSGSALALVVSQSVQFASMLEQGYNALLEDVGTCILTHLKTFSFSPRTAVIAGKFNGWMLRSFKKEDISGLSRVVVEQSNPLSKTVSGRIEIANQLMQQGLITDPRQYLTVLQTGNLDATIEDTQSVLLSVRGQCEALRSGETVIPLVTDDHALCIREAKAVLDNPEARKRPDLVSNVLAFIQTHLDLWRQADPAVLAITGQAPPPPTAPPIGQASPEGIQPAPIQAPGPGPLGSPDARMPNMPSLPPGTPLQTVAAYEEALA